MESARAWQRVKVVIKGINTQLFNDSKSLRNRS